MMMTIADKNNAFSFYTTGRIQICYCKNNTLFRARARNTYIDQIELYRAVSHLKYELDRHVTISFCHVTSRPTGMLEGMQRTRLLRNTTFIRIVYDDNARVSSSLLELIIVGDRHKLQSFKLTNEFLFVCSEQRRACNFASETRPR